MMWLCAYKGGHLIMKYGERIKVIAVVGLVAITLYGCGVSLKAFVTNGLRVAFTEREAANIQIIKDLQSAGFITEQESAMYTDAVRDAFKDFTSLKEGPGDTLVRDVADGSVTVDVKASCIQQLQHASSHVWTYDNTFIQEAYPGTTDEDADIVFLGNFLYKDDLDINGSATKMEWAVHHDNGMGTGVTVDPTAAATSTTTSLDNADDITKTGIKPNFEGEAFSDKYIKVDPSAAASTTTGTEMKSNFEGEAFSERYLGDSFKPAGSGNHSNVEQRAIAVFNDKEAADINSKFDFEVYVLKPLSTNTSNTSTELYLDGIVEMVASSIDDKGDIINYEKLNNYFMPAIDENGNPVKLIDMNVEANKIVRATSNNSDPAKNQCGRDMVICQVSNDFPQISVVLKEFSKQGFDNLVDVVGDNNRRYLLGKAGTAGANRAYLVEYPVYFIKTIKDTDDTYAEATVAISDMGVNMKTQEIIKYDSVWDGGLRGSTIKGQPVSMIDNYYSLKGAESDAEAAKASFVVTGVGTVKIHDGDKDGVEAGRIICRDYLEGTYLPGAVNDTVAVLGRKFRIENMCSNLSYYSSETRLSGAKKLETLDEYELNHIYFKKSNVFARYYDIEGNMIPNSPEIHISDLADFYNMNTYNPDNASNLYIRPAGEKEAHGTVYDPKANATNTQDKTDNELLKGIKTVKKIQGEKIEAAVTFPGKIIDMEDCYNNMNNDMPFYFVMCVATDMYQNALYSNWIASSASTSSLKWWDDYLAGKNFIYDIDKNAVLAAITGVYQYEVDDKGNIIINLDDIGKLNDKFDEQAQADLSDNARTIFIILGYLMIGLSVIFIVLWTMDTSTDLGLGLLEKATFGHWVAVKHDEDVPMIDTEGRAYLTFGRLLMRCSIIAAVGIVFIVAPIFQIILALIKAVGGIAREFSSILNGK